MPEAEIYVIDNASKDRTNELARAAYQELGCKGRLMLEPRKGKAAAVRKAFFEIDADIYVMADADMTYPASDLPDLLAPVLDGRADIVCGNRHDSGVYKRENKRPFHDFGNNLVRWLINRLFNGSLEDILTGYRIMSKRFVKNYPILAGGFELETEMSIHALDKGYSIIELPTDYRDRPEGSFSKLNTIADGILVLKTIFSIFVKYRPLLFFSICAVLFAIAALAAGSLPVIEYFQTGKILHIPAGHPRLRTVDPRHDQFLRRRHPRFPRRRPALQPRAGPASLAGSHAGKRQLTLGASARKRKAE